MKIRKQNGFAIVSLILIFKLILIQPGYAFAYGGGLIGDSGKALIVGGVSAATGAALIAVLSGSRTPTSPPDEEVNIEEIPSEVPTSFPVKITASKDDFSGRVYLSSLLGTVEPSYVDLVDGQWVGDITISEIGKGNRLQLRWDDKNTEMSMVRVSNAFDTVDKNNQIPKQAALVGTIADSDNNPIHGATIKLISGDPAEDNHVAHTVTDKNGNYRFHDVPPGAFHLKIEKDGYEQKIQKTALVAKRLITAHTTLSCNCNANGKVPVLLVPGIMGSYSKEKAPFLWPYPRLSSTPAAWDSGELELLDPFGQIGWGHVVKMLQKLGYQKDCTVFTVPYDWSLSVPEIRDQYLLPWIARAKQLSKSDKVDIIAHSMGGLITRSYVQSSLYQDDVRKFAMVGTPNKGAAAAYYIWEAGDTIEADTVSDNTGITDPVAYFYSNTLNYFYYDRYASNICKFNELRRYEPSSCDRDKLYTLLHKQGVSSGQLMPIYDYALLNNGYNTSKPIIEEENRFLKALNNLPCFNPKGCVDSQGGVYSYKDPRAVFTSNASGVQTKLFVGSEESTLNSIYVIPQFFKQFYRDGIPQNIDTESGDGTVLPASVTINEYLAPDNPLEIMQKPAKHPYLISDFASELVEFITGVKPNLASIKTAPKNTLIITIHGRVQPYIDSVHTHNGSIKTENSLNLKKDYKIDVSSLVVENPDSGEYYITLNSPSHESYELCLSYYDGATNKLHAQRYLGYFDESTKKFTFNLDKNRSDTPIGFDQNFMTPTNLEVKNLNNKIQLIWQDKVGDNSNDVSYYEIYWKTAAETYMRLLGKSKEKQYLTDHDWRDEATNSYAVRAVLKNGKSTFLSQATFL